MDQIRVDAKRAKVNRFFDLALLGNQGQRFVAGAATIAADGDSTLDVGVYGIKNVDCVLCTLNEAPKLTAMFVSATWAGTTITFTSKKPTAVDNVTPASGSATLAISFMVIGRP